MSRITDRILLATRNRKKLVELERILALALPGVQVLGLDDVPDYGEVVEHGATFAENAALKAHAGWEHTAIPTVADDSGLCVDALNGMPGVLSARWAGGHGDDGANLRLVLDQLRDVPDERLTARFRCSVVLVDDQGERTVEGEMIGRLVREPRGANGFGYDPIFVPDGHEITSAELDSDTKDSISHRGNALRALVPILVERMHHA